MATEVTLGTDSPPDSPVDLAGKFPKLPSPRSNVPELLEELFPGLDFTDVVHVAFPVLQKLSSKKWTKESVVVRPLKGAMTNHVYECCLEGKGGRPRKVLVRMYGDGVEKLFSREEEVRTFEKLSAQGQGPKLLARFEQGRVEEWLHAHTLTAGELRKPATSQCIAAKLQRFHQLRIHQDQSPYIWIRLRSWLKLANEVADTKVIQEFSLVELHNEVDALERRFSSTEHRVGFCHNDLQYGNIMEDDVDGAITLIDYEYSCYNYIAFDIANHFCEWAANYHTDTPHILDFTKYPTQHERSNFIEAYLRAGGEAAVSEEDVNQLIAEVEEVKVLSHLHWGLWGIISGASSNIDFDYLEYARQRLQQYNISKRGLMQGAMSN